MPAPNRRSVVPEGSRNAAEHFYVRAPLLYALAVRSPDGDNFADRREPTSLNLFARTVAAASPGWRAWACGACRSRLCRPRDVVAGSPAAPDRRAVLAVKGAVRALPAVTAARHPEAVAGCAAPDPSTATLEEMTRLAGVGGASIRRHRPSAPPGPLAALIERVCGCTTVLDHDMGHIDWLHSKRAASGPIGFASPEADADRIAALGRAPRPAAEPPRDQDPSGPFMPLVVA